MAIGINEAVLIATKNRLINNLSSLQTELERDPVVCSATITSGSVIIGHPEWLPDLPVLICVYYAGEYNSNSMEEISQGYGIYPNIYVDIVAYLNPDYLSYNTISSQLQAERLGLARLADWVRSCWVGQNVSMQLSSSVLSSPDIATGYITSISTELSETGADGSLIAPAIVATLELLIS